MEKRGFTIVEILVVIAIISLLMGILLPALGAAREEGKSVVCLNNLRQMVLAADVYTNDNDGFYPLAGFMDYDNMSQQREWDFFRSFENGQIKECTPGFLWQGKGLIAIQQCPSFKGSSNSEGDPYTGYNYNASYIGGLLIRVGGVQQGNVSSKNSELRNPSGCVIFGDGQFTLGANKYMRSPRVGKLDKDFADSYRYAGAQGYRHLGRTNAGFCDGRAGAVREVFTDTSSRQVLEEQNSQNRIKTGFLSSDNSAYDLE
jgi:prepilin-type N-terminal cleavage/methylation domain-containing protein/prepilin-type processing-associated H-X9-DG protein